MPASGENWESLSNHILVKVFLYLSRNDRIRAAQACKSWNEAFSSPDLWKSFNFWFYMPNQGKSIGCIEKYGKYLRNVYIELDQGVEANRQNACLALTKLSQLQERRFQTLKISFTGENPCFYAGNEFVSALKSLFGPPPENCNIVRHLTDVDLSNLTVAFTGDLIVTLAENNSHLERLNVQNGLLICKVHPSNTLALVENCAKLKDLRLYKCSITVEVLEALAENGDSQFEHLSLISRIEEQRIPDFGDEIWGKLAVRFPKLRVTLIFESSCPQMKISEVMKPSIPVRDLRFNTFSPITEELRQAVNYYHKTLEKIVIQSQMPESSEFNDLLIEMASRCSLLSSVHVSSVVDRKTAEEILSLLPNMESYTLKHDPEQ